MRVNIMAMGDPSILRRLDKCPGTFGEMSMITSYSKISTGKDQTWVGLTIYETLCATQRNVDIRELFARVVLFKFAEVAGKTLLGQSCQY